MNRSWRTSSTRGRSRRHRSHRHRGTTLLEVLAGLVVLGTLLVSVAIARGRFIRQWSDADRKLAAIQSADLQIARWLAGPPDAVPIDAEGSLEGPANCVWRTRQLRNDAAGTLGAAVVRMEVIDRARSDLRLVQVDFLLRARPVPTGGTP